MSRRTRLSLPARFAASRDGVALVEFAIAAPFMVFLYFGVVALTAGFSTSRKVAQVSRTAADLTARALSMGCSEVAATLSAAKAVLAPHDPTGLNIAIASVAVTNIGTTAAPNLQAKVQWSQARKIVDAAGTFAQGTLPSAWAPNSIVTPIPSGFAVAGSTFLMARADKGYTPTVGAAITGTVNLWHNYVWPARNPQQVAWTGTTSCTVP